MSFSTFGYIYPPLGQCRQWVRENGCPHGFVCGLLDGSHPYLRSKPTSNFVNGSTLSQADVSFFGARFFARFFLMSNFSKILASFVIVTICLSVLKFSFIRFFSVLFFS